ncbi:sushi, von Willebrand factor type A, EGF and pentraxin domain-containing protein 1-like isoform X2 [Tetranychus urticae]|uniref:sushi, von Willebrand factor type A, EGF and pentraxin domain-containing protein 1-like isoform X2 n=1 Tax=Tetranychus urticae TaxID=32264 RepID=UPI00077BFBF8|nr:sushi, von Willebrand factor type A, EGF and pentraxin domain-containing protein 1-like isoform X2 [Tetranychus urticae]
MLSKYLNQTIFFVVLTFSMEISCDLLIRPIRHVKKQASEALDSVYQDDLCPRSREEAVARGRSCLKKCVSDADCISSRKRCLCDGLCGWSCVRPDLNCDEMTTVKNGEFKVSGNHFGARVSYTCLDGFYMSGPRERVCQGDGSWSDQPPVCRKEAMCRSPLAVPHARHNAPLDQTEFPIDDMVQYSCFPGYESKGFAKAKCLFYNGTAQWFGPDLKCIPVRCDKPVDPENGKALYSSTNYKSVVKYECRFGYSLVGSTSRTCGPDKQWEGETPKCVEIDCVLPLYLANGYIEGRRTSVGSVIWFKCYDEMVFMGPSASATCLENGTWSHPLPDCLSPCIVPDIINGRINNVAPGSRVAHGTAINATCKPQYELSSSSSPFLCNNDTWTHIPKCIPARCKKLPEKPKHGIVIASKTDHGSRALYKCLDGYNLIGSNTTQCYYGKWTKATPVCNEADCKSIESKPWMDITIVRVGQGNETYPHGTLIQVSCSNGYSLNIGKNRTAKCLKGHWKPRLPSCLLSPCSLPHLDNGQYFINSSSSLPSGSRISSNETVSIACDPGYQIVSSSSLSTSYNITCSSGHWSLANRAWPECVPSSCSLPQIFNGYYLSGYRAGLTISHDSSVEYQCLSPYHRLNDGLIKCFKGSLSPEVPLCVDHPMTSPTSFINEKNVFHKNESESSKRNKNENSEEEEEKIESIIEEDAREEAYLNGLNEALAAYKWCPPPLKIDQQLKYHHDQLLTTLTSTSTTTSTTTTTIAPSLSSSLPLMNEQLNSTWSLPFSPAESATEFMIGNISMNETNDKIVLSESDVYKRGYLPPGSQLVYKCVPLAGPGVNRMRNFRKTTWKIICDSSGSWSASGVPCEEEEDVNLDYLANKSCTFESGITIGENVLAFIEDSQTVHDTDYPPGTTIHVRCVDIGKYSLHGSAQRKCVYGDWDGIKPTCYGLSQQHDYALEKPPTILFRHLVGPIAQSNDGKLIVYPGTILHLECLWIRKFGTPTWEVNHAHRAYPQGWTTDPARDSSLEYRLSIYHADETDSGEYTCVTPVKHRHSVKIEVKAIYCPELSLPDGVQVNNNGFRMNTKVTFSCIPGMVLQGSDSTTCLPSGRWSNPVPKCLSQS